MVNPLQLKIISTVTLFVMSMAGGIAPFFMKNLKNSKRYLSWSNSFSGGVFLGAGMLHLFADSSEDMEYYTEKYNYPLSAFIIKGSPIGHGHSHGGHTHTPTPTHKSTPKLSPPKRKVIVDNEKQKLLDSQQQHQYKNYNNTTVGEDCSIDTTGSSSSSGSHSSCNSIIDDCEDQFSASHQQDISIPCGAISPHSSINYEKIEEDIVSPSPIENPVLPFLLVIALSIHSIFEGLALGIQNTESHVIDIMIAIFAHKILAAFALGVAIVTNTSRPSIVKLSLLILVFSLASPIGSIIGMIIVNSGGTETQLVSAILQGIASGTFLYVSVVEVIPKELNHTSQDIFLKSILLLIGFGGMALAAIWV
ncbi:hypothetical protein CYY_005399 [Polysphondylium violaceum]|uniref:Zinc/iron permease n=1 Tax=Polysphondylium violaceum TaxID=133409 RepID=A0A8J4PT69_9MYCE|nr:hypothetical protein CYY_005399 [Polysphondylium violaceum]